MFDINVFFENFKDRNGFDELSKKLRDISEPELDGRVVKVREVDIPCYSFKPELKNFTKELENNNWDQLDIDMFGNALKIYRAEYDASNYNDIQIFSLCMMCKDLFPEKTELFDLIIEDLEKGTDNRSKYVDLFDLQSNIVNSILFYMS